MQCTIRRCVLTLLVLAVSKLTESPRLLQISNIVSPNLTSTELESMDLSDTGSMPLFCETVCMLDNFLVILLMYYVATLFVYLFCRAPNPDVPTTSEMTLRVNIATYRQQGQRTDICSFTASTLPSSR